MAKRFTRLQLENWRNFREVDVHLGERVFLVGPNAAGKSNLLDALRFLRTVAEPGGGIARAIEHPSRRGVKQIRSLHARQNSSIVIRVTTDLDGSAWDYELAFNRDAKRAFFVEREVVRRDGESILVRPDAEDRKDAALLTQTHLEQVSRNHGFRPLAEFLTDVRYLHVIPQLVREPDRSIGRERDPFGGDFLEQLARTTTRVREARLKKIESALKVAVPNLAGLRLQRDPVTGTPHLEGRYEHWRHKAGWQSEEQFSDGTLRLLGLLWSFLDGDAPLLLEEPELSLHTAVVRYIPQMLHRLNRKRGRQVILSTHSPEMLLDEGIGAEEILLLEPRENGTQVHAAGSDAQIRSLLEAGVPLAEAVVPRSRPQNPHQLTLFDG